MPVQFDEQDFGRPNPMKQHNQKGGVTKLIMKMGLAKDAKQANVVLLVIAVVAIALAAYLMWPESSATPVAPTAADPTLAP